MRHHRLYEYFKSLKAGHLVITSPRLLLFLPHLMRFDPCIKAIGVTASVDALIATMAKAGVDSSVARLYAQEYLDTIRRLAASHPKRVMQVTVDDITNEPATATALTHFAGLNEL